MHQLKELTSKNPNIESLNGIINKKEKGNRIYCRGLKGSARSLYPALSSLQNNRCALFILKDKEEAAYFYNDLQNYGFSTPVFFLPSSYKRSVQYSQLDNDNVLMRTEVIDFLTYRSEKPLIVTFPEALVEKIISRSTIEKNTLQLRVGENISIEFINDILYEYNFERVEFVVEPGQFSVRGSIVDIFSFSYDKPYRIDFFGDDVDSIRIFDIETQLSDKKLDRITILPNIQEIKSEEARIDLFSYLSKDTLVWINGKDFVKSRLDQLFEATIITDKEDNNRKSCLLTNGSEFEKNLDDFFEFEIDKVSKPQEYETIDFETSLQPHFNKSFELLSENLNSFSEKGYKNFILSNSKKQIERIQRIFTELNFNVSYSPLDGIVHEGFIDHDLKACFYTDHQIFERFHRFIIKDNKQKKASISLQELNTLQMGDYVVHIDHGIGKFGGLHKLEVNGKKQEVIRLVYKDDDILFVNIHSLHKISKYKGKDGSPPKVYKLGTGAWQKLKQKTKSKVKDIARELIALYAERKMQKGFAFSADSYLQQELEASFIYEDTPDQEKATEALKKSMEAPFPMDRLICGDVGFGKTEVAIRAAFKAVADSKQVAILVPTTILALQHYKTFSERLKDFPANIDYISRLKTSKSINESIKKLKEGKIDIIIGTHRLVSKDIQFKDLGLLIIDEEQKFGVGVKEKLKKLKINVDTLTLTATPIPRTLQFSLLGARDLSVINTPPPNRQPVATEVHTFNEDIIKEAINYELDRNGQIFFVNNRIQNLNEIESLIKRLCPDARTIVGHGQMEGPKLEKIMLDFINYEYDILIATTIIESGLDIPNANTIVINDAHHFGLSDLHQLRGRVGRSNKKAFCYLIAPEPLALTQEARRRLSAIEDFSELGSGFNIALQDLDIRGAGNLLGGEQSGFITDIGYETYQKILDETIEELKLGEFHDLYADEEIPAKEKKFSVDCIIDTDLSLIFPDYYISSVSERIKLYRELDSFSNEQALDKFKEKLMDRFGALPKESEELLQAIELRWLSEKLGFEKLILKNEKLIIHFISDQGSTYYQTSLFQSVLNHVLQNPLRFKMKEAKNKLTLTVDKIFDIKDAFELIKQFPSVD